MSARIIVRAEIGNAEELLEALKKTVLISQAWGAEESEKIEAVIVGMGEGITKNREKEVQP